MTVANNPFTRRGIIVEVETIEPAELDLQMYEFDEEAVNKVGRSLANLPVMQEDAHVGAINIRAVDGIDVAFIISRTEAASVVTIIRFWPKTERDAMMKMMQSLGWIAMMRGATGI